MQILYRVGTKAITFKKTSTVGKRQYGLLTQYCVPNIIL